MKFILSFIVIVSLIFTTGVAMANTKAIQTITYFNDVENAQLVAVIGAAIKIVSGEADFEKIKPIIPDIRLFYPKDWNKPVTEASASVSVANVGFYRLDKTSPWNRALVSPSGSDYGPYQVYYPDFSEIHLKGLNLSFQKEFSREDDDYVQDRPGQTKTHTVHIFEYLYPLKNGKNTTIQFEVSSEMFQVEKKYPRHFYTVVIERHD